MRCPGGSDQAFNADAVVIAEWRDPSLAGKWTAIQSGNVAATTYLVGQNKAALAERITRWARLAFPVVFGAVFFLIWWM